MVSFIAKIVLAKIVLISFWPKTMDYSIRRFDQILYAPTTPHWSSNNFHFPPRIPFSHSSVATYLDSLPGRIVVHPLMHIVLQADS